jgi:phosphopantothenoylcysteine decarboxylase / phosphopantothenate---cysteine ligase
LVVPFSRSAPCRSESRLTPRGGVREEGDVAVGKTILLGVAGGIAAFKSATVCSSLVKRGYDVQVLMTANATRFIQPLTFQALSRNPVLIDTFDEPNPAEIAHIAKADAASAYLIAPATANVIGKLAAGIADDVLTTTALAIRCPLIVAPAMNVNMYEHPAVQENLRVLRKRGAIVIEPGTGPLACGWTGKGRLPEPEDIVAVVEAVLRRKSDLSGVRVLVTAGPTIEDIDPVRYLSNNSSGKMGYAIAAAAAARGAAVQLISGPTHLPPIPGVDMVHIRSTEDLLRAVSERVGQVDLFVSAAAPADFRPAHRLQHKWKKSDGVPVLELEPTPDVLATVSREKREDQCFVGFAAETTDAIAYGRSKLERKNLDLVVVNNVSEPGAGFAVDTNKVTVLQRGGPDVDLPLMSKAEVADALLDLIVEVLAKKGILQKRKNPHA